MSLKDAGKSSSSNDDDFDKMMKDMTKLAEIQETLWKIISQQLFGGIWVKKV